LAVVALSVAVVALSVAVVALSVAVVAVEPVVVDPYTLLSLYCTEIIIARPKQYFI
jgi:hypothetical protein